MDRPVSDELRALLGRQGMRGKTAGTGNPCEMKRAGGHADPRVATTTVQAGVDWMRWANDLLDDGAEIEDHSPAGGEERPVRKPRVRIVRAMPFLAIIDGGLR
ncbi:MAG: hypothetical protein P0Y65_05660 [Candidatus Devosia phytovorans]|uniref:Uncharacterized protein n=1 Tax=Candidatus Devosia phytovorans TaxID=3121372 RepID=A0AAJ5VVM8_9HYPH|nr:hypothetical protein [Devosia sp.]WEK05741.1 MAG: hypothetical protein P0Y65_05660 [Devosia sp.]